MSARSTRSTPTVVLVDAARPRDKDRLAGHEPEGETTPRHLAVRNLAASQRRVTTTVECAALLCGAGHQPRALERAVLAHGPPPPPPPPQSRVVVVVVAAAAAVARRRRTLTLTLATTTTTGDPFLRLLVALAAAAAAHVGLDEPVRDARRPRRADPVRESVLA